MILQRNRRRRGRPNGLRHDAAWHAAMMGNGPHPASVSWAGRRVTWEQNRTISLWYLVNGDTVQLADLAELQGELSADMRRWGWW